jgi:2-octaprenyl-6-methoxyphenol hydroxylase
MTEPKSASHNRQAAVVGGGPAGLATAIALAQAGADTILIARRSPYADNRTTALLGGSVEFLLSLDVWQRCGGDAAALRTMRLVDDTSRLIRSPEVTFTSAEIGMEAFGYNIENRLLMVAMEARADELPNLVRIDDDAESVVAGDSSVAITTKQGQPLSAALVIGADGRHSLCREAAGIAVKRRDLGQSALTLNVTHTRPHGNCSTEFHTESGPCVFVPLPGERSSVVWVVKPDEAARLKGLDDKALALAAEKQSHSILGKLTIGPSCVSAGD